MHGRFLVGLRNNDAAPASNMGRELDHQYNNARRQMTVAFGRIDASIDRLVDRLCPLSVTVESQVLLAALQGRPIANHSSLRCRSTSAAAANGSNRIALRWPRLRSINLPTCTDDLY